MVRRSQTLPIVALAAAAGLAAAPVQAADILFTLNEATASDAVMLIEAGGARTSPLTGTAPCLVQRLRPVSRAHPLKLTLIDRIYRFDRGQIAYLLDRPVVRARCNTIIGFVSWSWKVISASVDFTPSGATLNGQILVEHSNGSTFTSFSLPAQIVFVPTDNSLHLGLQSGIVPISVYIGGTLTSLGTVNLTPFYQASLPLTGTIPVATGGNVSSSLSNVSLQYSNSAVTVQADVSFD